MWVTKRRQGTYIATGEKHGERVCARETERQRDRERERMTHTATHTHILWQENPTKQGELEPIAPNRVADGVSHRSTIYITIFGGWAGDNNDLRPPNVSMWCTSVCACVCVCMRNIG
jgi:hypothetical protein